MSYLPHISVDLSVCHLCCPCPSELQLRSQHSLLSVEPRLRRVSCEGSWGLPVAPHPPLLACICLEFHLMLSPVKRPGNKWAWCLGGSSALDDEGLAHFGRHSQQRQFGHSSSTPKTQCDGNGRIQDDSSLHS